MEPLNPKIIQIVLRHYFCNVEHLTEEESLKYYLNLISIINNNNYSSWFQVELDDYIIWEPFEDTDPSALVDNMNNLYQDIHQTLQLQSPNIIINPYTLATKLAESGVECHYFDSPDSFVRTKEMDTELFRDFENYYINMLRDSNEL